MAGDGGSSGRLRRELGVLPPGDVRKALLALAEPASPIAPLLAYRFVRGELAGHPVGNLVLAALADLKGGLIEAVDAMSRLLGVQGRVLPLTLTPVELRGRGDGREVHGQEALTRTPAASSRSGSNRRRRRPSLPRLPRWRRRTWW
jgi:uncharacterized cofD-like protein